tara:strand:+ start:141 stop:425 length:285 start_codon:yes stop_codon:yes gene_type:complete
MQDEDLTDQLARDRARELLYGIWSSEEIELLKKEQEDNEAMLDHQFNLNQLTTGEELSTLKEFIDLSQLQKANAKGISLLSLLFYFSVFVLHEI